MMRKGATNSAAAEIVDNSSVGVASSESKISVRTLSTSYAEMCGHKNRQHLGQFGGSEGLLSTLNSTFSTGIKSATVAERTAVYGRNKLPPAENLTFFEFVKETLDDKTMKILMGAAVMSLVLGMTTPDPRTGEIDRSTGWIEGFAILISIAIVTLVSSVNNYQKQEQFSVIMEQANKLHGVAAVRDGVVQEVRDEDICVGDVVTVFSGMALSFDSILLEGEGILCDESSMTGEFDHVGKSVDADPFLISGTNVVEGAGGVALVVAVGETSFAGTIAMAVREGKKDTPLQEQLNDMAETIGKFGLFAAIFTFAALTLKELWVIFVNGGAFYANKLFENITTAVAIVVVAVPEGLPLSVTISLAYSMKRMLQDGNLVRHLAACETMGVTTTICSDKTGTITSPNTVLKNILIEGKTFTELDAPQIELSGVSESTLRILMDTLAANFSDTYSGNKTSEALLCLCEKVQLPDKYNAFESMKNVQKKFMHKFPFSSIRKQSSTVVQFPEKETSRHFAVGAAEFLLMQCNSILLDGKKQLLSAEMRKSIDHHISENAKSGFRMLCCAYSEKNNQWGEAPRVPPEDVLTFVAVVALEEPIRVEVKDAVSTAQSAGMNVIMVTGDHLLTAICVAKRSGIYIEGRSQAMDGPTFRSMSDEAIIQNVLPTLAVLARATPLEKKRLVTLIKTDPQQVVAVTGDGTNDAPALKAADVGFSMNCGSDIAKRASDIVLLQDNFAGMVKAAMWGRNVRDNIRKFLQFQITVNLAACVTAFFGAIINTQNVSPLKPVQLLWLNLIMDTLAALALATELPCERKLLNRNPEKRDNSIISKSMWVNIIAQSAFQLFIQMFLLGFSHTFFNVPYFSDQHLTFVFNTFVMMQIFNFFNARLLQNEVNIFENIQQSKTLLYIVFVIFVSQVIIIQKGGKFMSTTKLTPSEWVYGICIGSLSLLVGSASRYVQTTKKENSIVAMAAKLISRWRRVPRREEEA